MLCLSPLGVRPDAQGRGIGRALVEAACAAAEADGEPFVVLEGAPAMYSGFEFVAAAGRGLRRPSERTPAAAFQVRGLAADRAADPALRGRVLYPDVFWRLDAIGLPMGRPAFLDTLEQACRDLETRVRADDGAPDVAELVAWFAAGWRALQELLDDRGFDTPTATWSPWDASCGFWHRRMAHEAAVHALDVSQTLPHKASGVWWVPDDVALDGSPVAVDVLRAALGRALQ